MPERGALRSSRLVRWSVRLAALAGTAVSGLYAAMGLMSHGTQMLLPAIIVAVVLVGRPLLVLRGRTLLAADRITVRRGPIGRAVVPIAEIGIVETRRGIFLEWPVLCLRDGGLVELAAPMRFWFRADPVFERGLAALGSHVGERPPDAGPYHQWSLSRLVAGPVITAAAVALVLIDPPWASDAWPLRPHATALPDACRMFDAKARRLLPGAQVDRTLSRTDDSDPHVKRHTCQWNASHRAPDGTTLGDIGRLSVELELDRGIGPVSDAQEAHRAFTRAVRAANGADEHWLPRTGDEAELITEPAVADFAWVTVAVRRANVEEKIDLVYQGRARQGEAGETARRLALLGMSEIVFR